MKPESDLRRAAFSVAFRMTGVVADAEDIAQDAMVKWYERPRPHVHSPASYVGRIAANLSLVHLDDIGRDRLLVRDWLPEPLVEHPADVEQSVDFTYATLVALQALTPLERAVFLLRSTFDCPYSEIGQTLSRSPAACRQANVRALRILRDGRNQRGPHEPADDLLRRLWSAIEKGDLEHLRQLLASDVVVRADGGTKGPALKRPLVGRDVAAKFLVASHSLLPNRVRASYTAIRGEPALIMRVDDTPVLAVFISAHGREITSVFAIADRRKLGRL